MNFQYSILNNFRTYALDSDLIKKRFTKSFYCKTALQAVLCLFQQKELKNCPIVCVTPEFKEKSMSEDKKSFVVKDRRLFTEEDTVPAADGEDKKVFSKAEETASEDKSEDKKASSEDKTKKSDKSRKSEPRLPEINFPTFIFSLHSSVLMQLGLIEDPVSGKNMKNLPAAKQTIDILGMLEEKTRGNLTNEEENMLKNILYDLRIMYVKEKGI